jgi:hypothetical protein
VEANPAADRGGSTTIAMRIKRRKALMGAFYTEKSRKG